MAGLKAILLWLPRERVAFANGWFMMLGVVSAATPAEIALTHLGWRGVFGVLAAAASALLILVLERRHAGDRSSAPFLRLKDIYCHPRFWRLASLSATCGGSSWALQGLWAGPWLVDVEGLKTVVQKTGLLRAPIDRYVRRNLFPAAWRIGPNRVAWVAAELVAWIETRPRFHSAGWSVE